MEHRPAQILLTRRTENGSKISVEGCRPFSVTDACKPKWRRTWGQRLAGNDETLYGAGRRGLRMADIDIISH